jgi:hypothetical protein
MERWQRIIAGDDRLMDFSRRTFDWIFQIRLSFSARAIPLNPEENTPTRLILVLAIYCTGNGSRKMNVFVFNLRY